MSIPIPLTIRLVTSRSDRVVTRDTRDIQFRSTAPGGFASAQITLDRPLSVQPDEIDYFGRLVITDARNGQVVWDGQLEDPGRTASDAGQVWQLTGIGPASHTRDRTIPYIVVDRDLRAFIAADNFTPGARAGVSVDPGDATGVRQALVMQFPQGLTVAVASRAVQRYDRIRQAGQKLARISFNWDAGRTDANFAANAFARTDGNLAGSDVVNSATLNTAGATVSGKVVVTNWTNVRNTLDLQLTSSTTGAVGDDLLWASFSGIVIRAMLYGKDGVETLAAGYTLDTILASEVVADLLGRLLPRYDGANASIATTTFNIEQLAYPDGVMPDKILSDLMLLEPAYYWAAWERQTNGRHRFEWTTWPTAVRYEADVKDGFDSPAAAADLYNSVRVRYLDIAGEIRTVQRTQTVASLTAAGLTREAFIDLGAEAGMTLTQASQAGDQYLAAHASPPNGGTLIIGRPISDLLAGRTVQPWEIRPGSLIRVRGVLPRVDALNPSGRDGVTIFRVVAVTYRTSSASAELELDSYPATITRALADLANRPQTRRR